MPPKITVPPFASNEPLLAKFPPISSAAVEEAVTTPLAPIVKLLTLIGFAPPSGEAALMVNVPAELFNVPLLVTSPLTMKFEAGFVSAAHNDQVIEKTISTANAILNE